MTIENGIKKAIEGGWRVRVGIYEHQESFTYEDARHWFDGDFSKLFLDPRFWQSLVKGLGNKDEMRCDSPRCEAVQCEYAGYKDPRRMFDSFVDRIWNGGTPESFFETLN